jgi:hypothetical protein
MSKEFIELEWPKADQDRLYAAMAAMQSELGRSTKSVLKSAMSDLIRSVRAATKVAPKRRKIVQHKTAFDQARSRSDLQPYRVTGWLGKPRAYQTKIVWAQSKKNAVNKYATIRNRGLAKKAFQVAGQKLGGRSGSAGLSGVAAYVNRLARRQVSVDRGEDFIAVHNRIPYAVPALKGGEGGVNQAMAKAANSMEKKLMLALERAAA